jgi:hypothetical protein
MQHGHEGRNVSNIDEAKYDFSISCFPIYIESLLPSFDIHGVNTAAQPITQKMAESSLRTGTPIAPSFCEGVTGIGAFWKQQYTRIWRTLSTLGSRQQIRCTIGGRVSGPRGSHVAGTTLTSY